MIQLRNYQQKAVTDIRAAFAAGNRAPLLVMPCGSGKTPVLANIASLVSAKGGNTLILVHRQELLMQACDKLQKTGVEYGVISANATMQLNHKTQVASVQTIIRRLDLIKKLGWNPSLIFIDEAAHAQEKNTWGRILQAWPNAKVAGCTATPVRSDGGGLDEVFDCMVMGPTIRELTEQGFLSPIHYYAPPMVASLEGVRKRMGDFAQDELNAAVDKPTVTGDAVEHYRRICPGAPAIAFCVSVSHAEHVAEQFRTSGFRAESVDGNTDPKIRRERLDALGNGSMDVITSCEIFGEGLDVRNCSVAILLRPTMSLGLFMQQCGRAVRIHPGKTHATILDHAANVKRHGLPDADREWSLSGAGKEGGAKREGPPPPVTCEHCFRQIVRPAPPCCPHCGGRIEKQAREEKLKEVAGELARIEAGEAEQMRKRARSEQGRAQTMEQLIALGKSRNMKNPVGWARHIFMARNRG